MSNYLKKRVIFQKNSFFSRFYGLLWEYLYKMNLSREANERMSNGGTPVMVN
jgi:hypothetical protein